MNLDELATLMGKTKEKVKEILEQSDVIELKLTEKNSKEAKEAGNIEVID